MIFHNDFVDKASICSEYHIADFDGVVIYADYEYENYAGSACVIFANEGKLYMVTGSHCSCYGLAGDSGESTWDPTEVTTDMLKHIAANGYGKDKEAAASALLVIEKFGHIEDPDALAAAVTLFFRH